MKLTLLVFILFPLFAHAQNGIITTIAGTGAKGYSGDLEKATEATFSSPQDVVPDAAGNLYIADAGNHVIRKINAFGVIRTVAGTGTAGHSGDGGPATNAQLNGPTGIAIDKSGNIYIADNSNNVIRKVTAAGIITTIAGNVMSPGFSGDGGPAAYAQLSGPYAIALDNSGNIYCSGDQRIRKINSSGIISTIAGNGIGGYNGDGMLATAAQLKDPGYMAISATGDIYVPDRLNHRVRKISAGIITTVAGNGTLGNSGDTSPAILAALSSPNGIAFDNLGNFFISDEDAFVIRKVSAAGIITTVAGNGILGYTGDGGPATAACISHANCSYISGTGSMYIADASINKIRRVAYNTISVPDVNKTIPGINLYPNPAHDEVTISSNEGIESTQIINTVGQVVHSSPLLSSGKKSAITGVQKMQLNLTNLPNGIYFVKVNGVYGGRFVKE